jgi:hypothetical protein
MTFSRSLGLIAAFGACWLSGAACSDDTKSGSSGPDGSVEAGTGGSSGSGGGGPAGSGGASGKSGSAGSAGSAGAAGAAGGRGGNAGAGGTAGADAGMPDASTGGAPPTMPDASVDGGGTDATAPGREAEAGPVVAKQCAYTCQSDNDCLQGTDAAADTSKKCDPVKKRCVDPLEVCRTNDDCAALASFWTMPCENPGDCLPGDVCIEVGGRGVCATPPDDLLGCLFPGTEPITRRRFGAADAATVDVCGSTAGRCDDGRCIIGCSSDESFCTSPGGFGATCNATTGMCECAAASECTVSGVSTCNTATHQCECARPADCAAEGKDTCVSGKCGCSSAAACPVSPYRNAPAVCE